VGQLPPGLANKVRLSYLGIPDSFGGILPQKNGDHFTIVSCSDLIPLKRIELLIETLRCSRLNICWIHVGDGPLRSSLEAMSRTLPENISVDFKGKRDNAQVLGLYHATFVDLFVSLSETEGLPVSMMEAASFGIPILSCDVNGVPEIVTSQTGILVDKEAKPGVICAVLEKALLHQTFDRESIRRFCQQKFNADRNFTLFAKQIKLLAGYDA
jgi:glycosyltransferase involved in cell wall biosynthesis